MVSLKVPVTEERQRGAGMKSAYSGSWSLYEFMDSRAEKWMSID